jgi:hypothetical protein
VVRPPMLRGSCPRARCGPGFCGALSAGAAWQLVRRGVAGGSFRSRSAGRGSAGRCPLGAARSRVRLGSARPARYGHGFGAPLALVGRPGRGAAPSSLNGIWAVPRPGLPFSLAVLKR